MIVLRYKIFKLLDLLIFFLDNSLSLLASLQSVFETTGNKLTLLIDLPGFEKKDIKLSLDGNILSIQACKEESEDDHHMICNQRPNVIDKKIRLPVDVNDEEDAVSSAKYSEGVLTITIPVHKHGKDIKVE